jgi:hypothetical protein
MIKFGTALQGPSCGRSLWNMLERGAASWPEKADEMLQEHFVSHMWLQDTQLRCHISGNQALLEEKLANSLNKIYRILEHVLVYQGGAQLRYSYGFRYFFTRLNFK